MNIEIANACSGYFETLYKMNQRFIKLCGIDIMNDKNTGEKIILDLIQDIPRVIPYSYNKKSKILWYKQTDGLLEFTQEMTYLRSEYDDILSNNSEFLDKVRRIRNKYEHKMHGAKYCSSVYGTAEIFDFTFEIEGTHINVSAREFIDVMLKLNILFDKIVAEVKQCAEIENKEAYPYYRTLCRHSFKDFNSVFESSLLCIIGKIFKDY